MRLICLMLILCCIGELALAQNTDVKGTIIDQNGKPLPFVSVWSAQTNDGTASNKEGNFKLSVPPGKHILTFRQVGYLPFKTEIQAGDTICNIVMFPIINTTDYCNADDVMHRAIDQKGIYTHDTTVYLGTLYSKGTQVLTKAPRMFMKREIATNLHLSENRQGIISLNESVSGIRFRAPDKIREYVASVRTTINENLFNFNSAPDFHVDLYRPFIHWDGLCDHGFVSPLSQSAFNYYRFYTTARYADGKDTISVIYVKPRHHSQYTFTGYIYINENGWRLYAADLTLGRRARIDFITEVKIQQQYVPVDSTGWAPQKTVFQYKGGLLGYHNGGYYLQTYTDVHADTAELKYALFTGEVYHSNTQVYQNQQLMDQVRPLPLTDDEKVYYSWNKLAERHQKDKTPTDSLQNTNNKFKLIPYGFNGYTLHNYTHNWQLNIPSPRSFVYYNTVEGWGIDLNPRFNKIFDQQRSLYISPDMHYGFSDKILNVNAYFNYRYNPFKQSTIYGGIGSDFLDLNNSGTITPFFNSLNTLILGNNYLKLYQSKFIMLGITGEVANGVLLNGQMEYASRRSLSNTSYHTFNRDSIYLTSNNPLDPGSDSPLFPEYRSLSFQGSATFTFRQEYKITPAGKFIQPNPFPRIRINFRKGIHKFGSDVNYSFGSIDVFQDRVNLGTLGNMAYSLSAGTFFNNKLLYFPDYAQFRGGQAFLYDATLGSFHFLNFYTYSTFKSYFEAHIEHNFAGLLLSQIPLLNRLHLQEIAGGSYLTQGTLPPYKEWYVGIKQRVFRVDYGMAFGRFTQKEHGIRVIYNF